MNVALCTFFGAQRHVHTSPPAALPPGPPAPTPAAAAPTPAAAAPTRQPPRPPLRWSHLQLRPGQSLHPRQPLVKGGADSMNVAFYRIYPVERHVH